uniref:AB hydrolase-1 domain-containing protein n=1 Tax=Megaselia scalaris TaxID=36166 RepID=T1GLU3_MEGSC
MICEKQFVKSIEEWRREMKIPQMILLGHSMGGFLASSYALSYPDHVKHLILADPWGFPERPNETSNKTLPLWVRAIAYALTPLNPLWALRAAGPFGQLIVEKTRPDITRKFSVITKDENSNLIPQYIHQCNAQTPSGESAFHSMMESFGWAKNPMINRIHEVRKDIPMTFIYGSRSWIDSSSGDKIKTVRADSNVSIRIVSGAGHHVYADKADVFNKYVNEACSLTDSNSIQLKTTNFPKISNDTEEEELQDEKDKKEG